MGRGLCGERDLQWYYGRPYPGSPTYKKHRHKRRCNPGGPEPQFPPGRELGLEWVEETRTTLFRLVLRRRDRMERPVAIQTP